MQVQNGRKLAVVLLVYLAVYLPIGLLSHARAYVTFVHHRHHAVPFALSVLGLGQPGLARLHHHAWYWPPWRLSTGHVTLAREWEMATTNEYRATMGLSAVWGATAEKKLALHGFTQIYERLVWNNEGPLSGHSVLTRVATSTSESYRFIEERWDPSQQKLVLAYATLHSTLRHVYSRGPVWFIFTATTSRRVDLRSGDEFAREALSVVLSQRAWDELPRGTFPGQLTPEDSPAVMESLAVQVAKVRQADLSIQPPSRLSSWIREINFRDAGLLFLTDSSLVPLVWSVFLEVPTLPLRYLLFFPLAALPQWLVLPLGLVYPVLLLVLVGWLAMRYWSPRAYLWWKWLGFVNALLWLFSLSP
ncbi:MAG: hypothetical protein KGZ66_04280 [Selenomonadales bacterium]|nr:hypothetical protein [Selenomonadales bacterium]